MRELDGGRQRTGLLVCNPGCQPKGLLAFAVVNAVPSRRAVAAGEGICRLLPTFVRVTVGTRVHARTAPGWDGSPCLSGAPAQPAWSGLLTWGDLRVPFARTVEPGLPAGQTPAVRRAASGAHLCSGLHTAPPLLCACRMLLLHLPASLPLDQSSW